MADLREKEMHRAQGTSHTVEGDHAGSDKEEDNDFRVADPEDEIRQRIRQQEHNDDEGEDGEAML